MTNVKTGTNVLKFSKTKFILPDVNRLKPLLRTRLIYESGLNMLENA